MKVMQIYCDYCQHPQQSVERKCLKCGTPFGGSMWMLLMGLGLAAVPFLLLFLADPAQIPVNEFETWKKLFFFYELPVITSTAFLYDYHPARRAIYFWGGTAVILAGVYSILA